MGSRTENLTARTLAYRTRGYARRVSRGASVIVTGAGGFIGSRALEPLLAHGFEVHALSRSRAADARVHWHAVDLLDAQLVAALVRELKATHLLHLAWFTEHGRFWSAPENLDWLGASVQLLRAFAQAGGERAVMAGTCAEYDWTTAAESCVELDSDLMPATPLAPATLYGAAKHATHLVSRAYAREAHISLAWGRIFLLYGPGEDERRLVPAVARALLEGREAQTSDGTQVRDLMHVDDVAAAFAALLASEVEGPVNVASGEPTRLRQVIEEIGRAAARPDLLRIGALPRSGSEPERLVADTARLRGEVGFEPQIALSEGIASTLAWWREQAAA